jgi:hypothetical protein
MSVWFLLPHLSMTHILPFPVLRFHSSSYSAASNCHIFSFKKSPEFWSCVVSCLSNPTSASSLRLCYNNYIYYNTCPRTKIGSTYRSHLRGSRKMGPIDCPETSVNNDHTTPRNIPEERRSRYPSCSVLSLGRLWLFMLRCMKSSAFL